MPLNPTLLTEHFQYIRRVKLIIVFLSIAIGMPLQLFASTPDKVTEKKLLVSLFPGSSLGSFASVFGRDSGTEVVGNITWKGMKGFVPIEKIISLKLSPSLSVIAFPIYLHNSSLLQDKMIMATPTADPSNVKLIQMVFYNHNNGKLYGKPPGFPLKSDGWTCGGDLCNNVEIVGFESIENSSAAVVFKYTEGISSHKLRVIAFDGAVVKSSGIFKYGDICGESEILASTEYSDWKQIDGSITAIVKNTCDREEVEFCRSIGLSPGTSSSRVLMRMIQADSIFE